MLVFGDREDTARDGGFAIYSTFVMIRWVSKWSIPLAPIYLSTEAALYVDSHLPLKAYGGSDDMFAAPGTSLSGTFLLFLLLKPARKQFHGIWLCVI